jgi:FkbM family methyltransferase
MDRVERLALAAFVLVFLVETGSVLDRRWVPFHFLVLKAAGRVDPRCPLSLARESFKGRDHREAVRLANRQRVSLVGREGPIDHWQTPDGPVWTSGRDRDGAGTAGLFRASSSIRWASLDGRPGLTVQPGDVVLDCGAHIGESTRAALAFGARLVVTVEPDPDNLAALRRNLEREITDGLVLVIDKGVYDREGTLTFVHRQGSRDGAFEEDVATGDSLAITTIDRIVTNLNLTAVNFIKMDIEGAEVPALNGARETIQRFKPRLAVGTYHRLGDLEGVERTVLAIRPDYRVECSRCLDEWYGRIFPLLLHFR